LSQLADFASELKKIIEALGEIACWEDAIAASKAKILNNSLLNIDFLFSLHCQVSVLHLFSPISNLFQKKKQLM